VARIISGAFCGWFVVTGSPAARLRAIKRLGAIPAALAEDVVAVALALFAVTRQERRTVVVIAHVTMVRVPPVRRQYTWTSRSKFLWELGKVCVMASVDRQ
jgi:hypothetical protein